MTSVELYEEIVSAKQEDLCEHCHHEYTWGGPPNSPCEASKCEEMILLHINCDSCTLNEKCTTQKEKCPNWVED